MRRALCVGIDLYPSGSLHGCVSDAERIADVLARHADGSPNFDCRKMVAPNSGGNDAVTKTALRQAVEELFEHHVEVALFHFSGHGTVNNLDGFLVTQDAERWDEGVPMSQVLTAANMSPATEVVILLDCCYSGNFGNPPAVYNKKVMLREGISILTASRDDQPSVETGGGGVFTSLVVDALSGGAADLRGEVSAPAVYQSGVEVRFRRRFTRRSEVRLDSADRIQTPPDTGRERTSRAPALPKHPRRGPDTPGGRPPSLWASQSRSACA